MGLEVATFVAGLTATNPLAADKKNQGDDHLRLIKAVLQATFPNADKAFYFDDFASLSADTTLAASYMNKLVRVDTSAAARTITLPSLAADDAGWKVTILKDTMGGNPVFVSAGGGNIASAAILTLTKIRCDVPFMTHNFVWAGAGWFHFTDASLPGTVNLFVGATIPFGHIGGYGQSLLRVDHPELFNFFSTTHGAVDGTHFNAPDLRDRFPVFAGSAYALAATGGEATHTLSIGELPTSIGSLTASVNDTRTFRTDEAVPHAGGALTLPGAGPTLAASIAKVGIEVSGGAISASVGGTLGSGQAHENRPPYFGITPIIRLC